MEKKLKRWLKELKSNEQMISMGLGALVVVVMAVLLVSYFRGKPSQPSISGELDATPSAEYTLALTETDEGELIPEDLPTAHTVSKGEFLWSIAEKYYGSGYNWVDIAEANGIVTADIVTEGQKLTIPKVRVRIPLDNSPQKAVSVAAIVTPADTEVVPSSYTVVEGDSLWSIAQARLGDGYRWTTLYDLNRDMIQNPGVIEVGWELRLTQ